MIRLSKTLNSWGTSAFQDAFNQEIAQMESELLPLQQGLTISSHVTDRPVQAMILSTQEEAKLIRVKAGIFYTGIIAGCSCADDPTPIAEQNEYCVVEFCIDRQSAETTVMLVAE
jgi:hypothetical protein